MAANNRNKRESGSSSLTVFAILGSAAASAFYLSSIAQKNSARVAEEKARRSVEVADIGSINSVSRYKALLSERKGSDGRYLPGLFASNYYAAVWNMRANPELPAMEMKIDSVGGVVQLESIGKHQLSAREVESVMEGATSAAKLSDTSSQVTVLGTQFDNNYRVAETLDVEVTTQTEKAQTAAKKHFRVPLQAPVPFNPIVEISPTGQSSFTQDFSQALKPGYYDIRVLASGVVYDADVIVNGTKIGTVGGFDQSGRITHAGVNPLAKNQEIGRITNYYFAGGESKEGTGDNILCKLIPAAVSQGDGNATFKLSATIHGPKASDAVSSEPVTAMFMSEEQADGHQYSTDELADACNTHSQCLFFGSRDTEDPIDPIAGYIHNGNFGDATSYHNLVTNAEKWGVKNRKLCVNFESARSAFYSENGRNPTEISELAALQGLYEFVYYHPKSCKRTFLFERKDCGCFASDTKILMGDGLTEKAISDLDERDQVWNPGLKKAMAIRRMTRGPEKVPLIRIVAEGQDLLVTGTHPFPTPDGQMKPAFELTRDDMLRKSDGSWVQIESLATIPPDANGPIVWNLELEGPDSDPMSHQVLANGVVTGDLVIQKQLQSKD